jgi:sulfite exporter TauE/SafE
VLILDYGAAFLVGLLGSGHCLVMCGGVATALEMALAPDQVSRFAGRAGYQSGRLLGYAFAGALVGGVGSGLLQLITTSNALLVARGLQAVMLILLGLYLSGVWRTPLTHVERWGAGLWRAIAPLRARLLPVRDVGGAVRMGMLWGFLPCGLVYSALALALASGGMLEGALTMLAFGIGTLPAMVLIAHAAGRMTASSANQTFRRVAGALIFVAGVMMGLHVVS